MRKNFGENKNVTSKVYRKLKKKLKFETLIYCYPYTHHLNLSTLFYNVFVCAISKF